MAAEVVGVGLAGLHRLRHQAAGGEPRSAPPRRGRGTRAARCRRRGESSARPTRSAAPLRHRRLPELALGAAALGGREHALELGEVVEGSLREHRAVEVERDRVTGCPGSRARAQTPASAHLLEARDRDAIGSRASDSDRRLERAADVTAGARRTPRARASAPARARSARSSPLRANSGGPLLGDLERAAGAEPQPQHADLAREREDGDAEAGAGEQRDDEPEAEPLVGRQRPRRAAAGNAANAAASTALRATAGQPTVERAPKQAQGAPARPRRIAPTIVDGEGRHQRRREIGGASSEPAITPAASTSSAQISSAQATLRARAVVDPERRQRRVARRGAGELRKARPRQHPEQTVAQPRARRNLAVPANRRLRQVTLAARGRRGSLLDAGGRYARDDAAFDARDRLRRRDLRARADAAGDDARTSTTCDSVVEPRSLFDAVGAAVHRLRDRVPVIANYWLEHHPDDRRVRRDRLPDDQRQPGAWSARSCCCRSAPSRSATRRRRARSADCGDGLNFAAARSFHSSVFSMAFAGTCSRAPRPPRRCAATCSPPAGGRLPGLDPASPTPSRRRRRAGLARAGLVEHHRGQARSHWRRAQSAGVSCPGRRAGRGRRAIAAIASGAVAIDSALLGLVAPLLPEIQARDRAGDEAVGIALPPTRPDRAALAAAWTGGRFAAGGSKLLTAGLLLVAAGSATGRALRLARVADRRPRRSGHRIGGELDRRPGARLGLGADGQARQDARRRARRRPGSARSSGPRSAGSTADLLVVRGPVPDRLGAPRSVLLVAALVVLPPEPRRGRDRRPRRWRRSSAPAAPARAPGAAADRRSRSLVLGLIEVVAAARPRRAARPVELGDRAPVRGLDRGRRGVRAVRRALGRPQRTRVPGRSSACSRPSRRGLLAVLAGVAGRSSRSRLRRRLQPRDLGRRPVARRGLRRARARVRLRGPEPRSTPAATRSARCRRRAARRRRRGPRLRP